jgi:AcrR family transcriptional regulator
MARTRTISDETILDAALGVISKGSPAALTFGAVAAEVGLAPATLVQRFASKEALLRAALLRAWDGLDASTAQQDAGQPVSIDGAIELLHALWPIEGDVVAYADGLLLLREDMRDPALRARGEAWLNALARALGRRLSADPLRQQRLGQLMTSQWQGAQIRWAFSRAGTPRQFIETELRDWCAVVLGRVS